MKRKPGKKIGIHTIEEGPHTFKVELRLVGDMFYAEFEGARLQHAELYELKQMLQKRAKEVSAYEWARYIEIECAVQVQHSHYGSHSCDIDKLDEHHRVTHLEFSFKVVDRTQPVANGTDNYNGRPMYAYLEREVREIKGELVESNEQPWRKVSTLDSKDSKVPTKHEGVIPFTEERYRTLCAIREAMKGLARKLHAVVGDPKTTAKLLDAFEPAKLLPLPADVGRRA